MGPGPLRKNITHQFTKLTSIPSLKVITFSAFLLEGSSQSNVFSMSPLNHKTNPQSAKSSAGRAAVIPL